MPIQPPSEELASAPDGQRSAVEDSQADREQTDRSLDQERRTADGLAQETQVVEEPVSPLAALLPLERETTDRSLFIERNRCDMAVSNRDDFLGMVSHDLNNLLGGIVLSASFISRNTAPTAEGQHIVRATNHIHHFAARMTRLIGDLVDVTSIAAGKLAVAKAPSDPGPLVLEVVEAFRHLAVEKGIHLESKIPDHPALARFDRDRIQQVLANLIANALKFTPRGGRILTGVERMADEVRFSVSDTGPGIPEDRLEAVFERFWQAGANDKRGLGLGLYIAKSLVEAHGGRIWAESRTGEGSTFHVALPVAR